MARAAYVLLVVACCACGGGGKPPASGGDPPPPPHPLLGRYVVRYPQGGEGPIPPWAYRIASWLVSREGVKLTPPDWDATSSGAVHRTVLGSDPDLSVELYYEMQQHAVQATWLWGSLSSQAQGSGYIRVWAFPEFPTDYYATVGQAVRGEPDPWKIHFRIDRIN